MGTSLICWQKIVLCSVFCMTIVGMYVQYANATGLASPWISGTPTMSQKQTYEVSSSQPAPTGLSGNSPDCNNKTVTYQEERNVGAWNYQRQLTNTECMMRVPYGYITSGKLLLLNGTSLAGRLYSSAQRQDNFLVVPNTNTVIETSNQNSAGLYVSLIQNAYSGLAMSKNNISGAISYTITKSAGPQLVDSAGRKLTIRYESLSYSDDGEWMVVDAPGTGFVRINTKTGSVLPFASSLSYINPTIDTAISTDGRYAVLAAYGLGMFRLYDLSTCTHASGVVQNCQFRDLLAYMRQAKPGYWNGASKIRFITNDTFRFYGIYDNVSSTNRKIGQFELTTPGVPVRSLDYLALGDSFASGEGAFTYKEGTDVADNRCHLSTQSYPYLLATGIGTGDMQSVACSGAKIKDIVLTNLKEYNDSKPQAKNMESEIHDPNIFSHYLPGYRAQLLHLNNNIPSIITVSIGGNDIGFSGIITKCVAGMSDCYKSYEDRLELANMIDAQFAPLAETYNKLKAGSPGSSIYVIGYPQIAAADSNCALNVNLSNQEIKNSQYLISYLNTVVRLAAESAGVQFVDTENAFEGKRLCEGKRTELAMHGLLFGNGGPIPGIGIFAKESYHPTKLGHALFAARIHSSTNAFTQPMPTPTNTTTLAFPNRSNHPLLAKTGITNRQIFSTRFDESMSPDMITINQPLRVQIDGEQYSLKPNTNYELVLHSNPVTIGTVTTDSHGNIDAQVTVPAWAETGAHSLRLEGDNVIGDKIAITKTVYVGTSLNDTDGDGIPNDRDSCYLLPQSGIDEDLDGIDDICDDTISDPPTSVPSVLPGTEEPVTGPATTPITDKTPTQFGGQTNQSPNSDVVDHATNSTTASHTNTASHQSAETPYIASEPQGVTDVAGTQDQNEQKTNTQQGTNATVTDAKKNQPLVWLAIICFVFACALAPLAVLRKQR